MCTKAKNRMQIEQGERIGMLEMDECGRGGRGCNNEGSCPQNRERSFDLVRNRRNRKENVHKKEKIGL